MSFVKRNIPNFITFIRIIGAIVIIFLEPFSLAFFIVYGVCGVSDAFDGFLARKLNVSSKLGSVLDSLSDILFLGVMAIKIIPVLINYLALWNWILFYIPLGLQLISYALCAIKFHKFSAIHTYGNKSISAGIFFFPFVFIGWVRPLYEIYSIVFSVVAIYASIEINLIHIIAKEYDEHNKTIFLLLDKKENATTSSDVSK